MSDIQDPLERAHDAALDAATAKRKAEQAYEQALAEETYEYSIQLKDHTGEWVLATNSETHLDEWWSSLEEAQWAADVEREYGCRSRLVRRRVSPPEVINE